LESLGKPLSEGRLKVARSAFELLLQKLKSDPELNFKYKSRSLRFGILLKYPGSETLALPDRRGVLRSFQQLVRPESQYLAKAIAPENLEPDFFLVSESIPETLFEELGIPSLNDIVREECTLANSATLKPSPQLTQIISTEWFAKALIRIYRSIQRRVPNDDLLLLIGDLKRFSVATCGQIEKFAVLKSGNPSRRISLSVCVSLYKSFPHLWLTVL
jgi:hypothetical protein